MDAMGGARARWGQQWRRRSARVLPRDPGVRPSGQSLYKRRRDNMRKMVSFAIVALLATTVVVGATARVQWGAGPKTVKKTTVTLTGWASSPAETAALRTTIRGFERSHPNYTVNYAPINGDYSAAMLAKFSARKPPDVFYVDSNVAPDWMSQRVLAPLDSLIKKNHYNIKPFFPRLVQAFRYKGHIYGLPKDWSPLA